MYGLRLLKGQAKWREIAIDRSSVLIGRDERFSKILLEDKTVSKKHFEIVPDGKQYFLIDRKSTAGTSKLLWLGTSKFAVSGQRPC